MRSTQLLARVDAAVLAPQPLAVLLGQVMGYVAVTVAFAALGAYLGRDLSGAIGLLLLIGTIPVVLGLNVAAGRGREQLAIGLLFGLGLLLGLAVAPVIADYASADPSALWQAAGATAAFVAALGAYGYATRRDLSSWGRTLFWALLGLIAFGIVAIFVSIPNSNVIYAVAGLGIFGAFTIYDFNRLRRSTPDAAVPIAAGMTRESPAERDAGLRRSRRPPLGQAATPTSSPMISAGRVRERRPLSVMRRLRELDLAFLDQPGANAGTWTFGQAG